MSFSTTFTVDRSTDEMFAAVNDVRSWWTDEIYGDTDEPGGDR